MQRLPAIADKGLNSPLGAGTTINLGATAGSKEGILLYTGANGSTNRDITIADRAKGGVAVDNATTSTAFPLFGPSRSI